MSYTGWLCLVLYHYQWVKCCEHFVWWDQCEGDVVLIGKVVECQSVMKYLVVLNRYYCIQCTVRIVVIIRCYIVDTTNEEEMTIEQYLAICMKNLVKLQNWISLLSLVYILRLVLHNGSNFYKHRCIIILKFEEQY